MIKELQATAQAAQQEVQRLPDRAAQLLTPAP